MSAVPVAAVLVATAAACSSGKAHVTGTLRETGGPFGASQPGVSGHVVFQSGSRRIEVNAAADGSFSASLPPGRYEVTGSSPLYGSGQGVCRMAGPLVVTKSGVTGIVVACDRK